MCFNILSAIIIRNRNLLETSCLILIVLIVPVFRTKVELKMNIRPLLCDVINFGCTFLLLILSLISAGVVNIFPSRQIALLHCTFKILGGSRSGNESRGMMNVARVQRYTPSMYIGHRTTRTPQFD